MSATKSQIEAILPSLHEVYQDVEVGGELLASGKRECASRFDLIAPSIANNQVIFDIGSSLGYFAARIARENPSTLVVSFESVPEHCEVQRKIAEEDGLFNLVICCHRISREDLERWAKCVECIDVILLLSVLHHFPKDDVQPVLNAARSLSDVVLVELPNKDEKKICGLGTMEAIEALIPWGVPLGSTVSHLEDLQRLMLGYGGREFADDLDSYIGAAHDGRNKHSVRRVFSGWTVDGGLAVPGVNAWNLLHFNVVWPPPSWWVEKSAAAYDALPKKSDVRPWNLLVTATGMTAIDYDEFEEGSPEFFNETDMEKLKSVFSAMKPSNPWRDQ